MATNMWMYACGATQQIQVAIWKFDKKFDTFENHRTLLVKE